MRRQHWPQVIDLSDLAGRATAASYAASRRSSLSRSCSPDLLVRLARAPSPAQPRACARAHLDQQPHGGDAGGTGAHAHHFDVLDALLLDLQRVEQAGAHHDGGAVLVVVEDRDVAQLLELLLDDETLGRLDILEIDRTEGGLQRADNLGQPLRIGLVHLDVETVDPREFLEEHRQVLILCGRAPLSSSLGNSLLLLRDLDHHGFHWSRNHYLIDELTCCGAAGRSIRTG